VEVEEQMEGSRAELRKLKAELEELLEKEGRGEARAAELQAVVDSLGRERATLRSEAGALRARVELLAPAEERVRRLAQELDELRTENEFLNQELARANAASPRVSTPPPLSKPPGA
jgi:chromosome segregation ATPase